MRTFTVHANASLPREDERVRFVKEGIAWWALVSPLLWFLYHRMWWEAVFALGLSLVLALGGEALGFSENAVLVTGLVFQTLIAVEANDLRRMALGRKAYRSVAVVHGINEAEAELRFFASWTGPLPTADIGATTSAVFDRRGERGNLISAIRGPRETVWPKSSSIQSQGSVSSSQEDVLGVFPKPQS